LILVEDVYYVLTMHLFVAIMNYSGIRMKEEALAMFSIERKLAIIEKLEQSSSVDVTVLAKEFGTSKETIRRDLRELETDGAITRTHGGAVLSKSNGPMSSPEYPVAIRGIQQFSEKKQICRKAASLIQDGDTIFVDNSSTMLYLAQFIPQEKNITVITNSIKFLLEAAKSFSPNHVYVCLGGIFRENNLSLFGNICLNNAEEYFPDKTFVSCAGISPHNMFADSSIQEINIKRAMIERAGAVYVLADYTKFQKSGSIFLTGFDSIDYIITDSKTDLSSLDYLEKNNIKLIVSDI